ncbi:MAG: hypothetical protein MCS20_01710 [Candidatus Phytoplasma mali]|nr:hypothetical protein [Candidatus Phytoplasma australiense]MBZ7920108.1 hypothetical protein [Candidatus Karelsulcia muelleri]MCG7202109.1 hypothetical protein [Candidatus Phytoplasma mali]
MIGVIIFEFCFIYIYIYIYINVLKGHIGKTNKNYIYFLRYYNQRNM